jgi:hypothetical protein
MGVLRLCSAKAERDKETRLLNQVKMDNARKESDKNRKYLLNYTAKFNGEKLQR